MYFGDDDYKTRSIFSLEKAIEGTKSISIEESKRNIEDNLVIVAGFENGTPRDDGYEQMITRNMKTGFRLTHDGWILIPYNTISEFEPEWKIKNMTLPKTQEQLLVWLKESVREYAVIDKNKTSYPIDTSFMIKMPQWNLALIKSIMPGSIEPTSFKVNPFVKINDPIELMGLSNQEIYHRSGSVYGTNCKAKIGDKTFCEDALLTTIIGEDEQGVFINKEGEFSGIAQFSVNNHPLMHGWTGGIDYLKIYAFVKDATNELKNKYCSDEVFQN